MIDPSELASSPRRVHQVYALALLLAFGLFLFHTGLLFDIARVMVNAETWLTELLGKHRFGKAISLGCFCFLFVGHIAEAAAWGLFLRWQRLVPTVSGGFYFAAVTITTLGLRRRGLAAAMASPRSPGRDCGSTEVRLLFVLMQEVWTRHL